jgi:hypothetical protein
MKIKPYPISKEATAMQVFESLPMARATFLIHRAQGRLPLVFENTDHPSEYAFTLPNGEHALVKYFNGKKLSCHRLVPYQAFRKEEEPLC